jgi:hypothetical protein
MRAPILGGLALIASALAGIGVACAPEPPPVAPPASHVDERMDDGGPLVTFDPSDPSGRGNGQAAPPDTPPADVLQRALAASNAAVKGCYDKGKNQRLAGHMRVKLHVRPDGTVERIEDVAIDLADPQVVTCVTDVLRKASLPPHPRPYEVEKGFQFKPEDIWPTAVKDGGNRSP